MNNILIRLIKIIFRTAFAYGLILLFSNEFNPLKWVIIAKIVFVVILIALLEQD